MATHDKRTIKSRKGGANMKRYLVFLVAIFLTLGLAGVAGASITLVTDRNHPGRY
jgi:hypothetical protein